MPAANGGGSGGIFGDAGGKIGDAVGDIGDGDGCLIAFAVIIVIGLIALAIGSAFLVVSMGPEILIEAAFNALLAGGLIKSGTRVSDPDWIGSVVKGTWLPFAIVLAAALIPNAHIIGEVWCIVWPLLWNSI